MNLRKGLSVRTPFQGQTLDRGESCLIDNEQRPLEHLAHENLAVGQDEVSSRGLADLANLLAAGTDAIGFVGVERQFLWPFFPGRVYSNQLVRMKTADVQPFAVDADV